MLAVSVVVLAVSFVSASFGSLLSLVVNIWEIFVLSGLIAGAHKYSHPIKGLGVIVLSLVLMVVGLLVFFTLIALVGPIEAANV